MCGIVGFVSNKNEALPVLLDGLTALEYRGYDSSGIAVLNGGQISVVKKKGRIKALKDELMRTCINGHTGIAHTRWATHGEPSDANSHPHMDISGTFAIVHNGIIENYLTLKQELMNKGVIFRSQTDTEVIAHLIAENYQDNLVSALQAAVKRLHGSFAILALCGKEQGLIAAAAKDNPLIIGEGRGENFIASDIPALLKHTKKVYRLHDGETAAVKTDSVTVFDKSGLQIDKAALIIDWDSEAAGLSGYESFMLKEINEIPAALKNTFNACISSSGAFSKIPDKFFTDIDNITVTACGTAYHAGMVGKNIIERFIRIPVNIEVASEFRYKDPIVNERTLCIAVSQSGETADTIAALKEAKARGCKTLAIANVVGSTLTYAADHCIPTLAGPEIAVASTKAYNSQLMAFYCLCGHIAKVRGSMDADALKAYYDGLSKLSALSSRLVKDDGVMQRLADECKDRHSVFFLGRGLDYAVAMEGSLKLKEISYIHSEAYPAGEIKHGTLALIENGTVVIVLLTDGAVIGKTMNAVSEVKARGAKVIAVAMNAEPLYGAPVDHALIIPECADVFAPMLAVIPMQKFAYYMARARGCDADKPRNLAKSVTVE